MANILKDLTYHYQSVLTIKLQLMVKSQLFDSLLSSFWAPSLLGNLEETDGECEIYRDVTCQRHSGTLQSAFQWSLKCRLTVSLLQGLFVVRPRFPCPVSGTPGYRWALEDLPQHGSSDTDVLQEPSISLREALLRKRTGSWRCELLSELTPWRRWYSEVEGRTELRPRAKKIAICSQ